MGGGDASVCLDVVEEDVIRSRSVYCDQCRVVGELTQLDRIRFSLTRSSFACFLAFGWLLRSRNIQNQIRSQISRILNASLILPAGLAGKLVIN